MPHRILFVAVALVAACTPSLDWREVRPEGSSAHALFPCKPRPQTRRVPLAGKAVDMTVYACIANDATWALGFADVTDPALVNTVLNELGQAAHHNLGAAPTTGQALSVAGMTPQPGARRLVFGGQLPDGRQVQSHVALFSKGTQVYQATVMGARLKPEAVETFFGALRLAP